MGNLEKVGACVKGQSVQALLVQSQVLSVLEQPAVDLTRAEKLLPAQEKINKAIADGQDTARHHLHTVLRNAIDTAADIGSFFAARHAAVGLLESGTDRLAALRVIEGLREQADESQRHAQLVATDLQHLRDSFVRYSSDVAAATTELAQADGALASITRSLGGVDARIGDAIIAAVLGGLANTGGVVRLGVGAVATVVTGDRKNTLVAGGGAAWIADAAATALAGLFDEKAGLIRQHAEDHAVITLGCGIAGGLAALAASATGAGRAAQNTADAWMLLADELGGLVTGLRKGQIVPDALSRLLAGDAANADVGIIRGHLVGAVTEVDVTRTVGDVIRASLAA
ncbi:hypothetical protein ACIA8G_28085 [Lentzea sp. NPDC051213]|uniref:hypothetical protein n=1 Tax=Lentzea sp. NPDC051213 TaxID=3364126 RepID=UPI0037B5BB29